MTQQHAEGLDEVWDGWQAAVTTTPQELEVWLGIEESRAVGQKPSGSAGHDPLKR